MKFHIEKLGCIDKADIELGDLTILCGDNNTGKTYVSYAIYGFLKYLRNKTDFNIDRNVTNTLLKDGILKIDLKTFEKKFPEIVNNLCQRYKKFIPRVFSAGEDNFSESIFTFSMDNYYFDYEKGAGANLLLGTSEKRALKAFKEPKSSLLEISLLLENDIALPTHILKSFINDWLCSFFFYKYEPFNISSERSGIPIFYRELDSNKNVLVEKLQEQSGKNTNKIDIKDFFEMMNNAVSRYAIAIKDGIDFVRDIPDHSKMKSELIKEYPELEKELRKISGGDYKVVNGQVFFSFKRGRKTQIIPLYMASSAVKSLLDLNIYIKHLAKKGDILMIDEPELNLHPANQRRMARLFVRLINAGIKVFVTTHSDYLVKELNNLIILGNDFENKAEIMGKYGYTEEDILDRTRVKVYIAEKNTLKPAPINELGIEIGSFDLEIREMNDMFDDMTETMDIAYE